MEITIDKKDTLLLVVKDDLVSMINHTDLDIDDNKVDFNLPESGVNWLQFEK